MAEQYRVDVIANVQQYIKPLSELPGVTKAQAEKAALMLAQSLGKVEGATKTATDKVLAFNKALIDQGVSEKAAAASSLNYAKSLAHTGAEADRAVAKTGNVGMAVAGVGQQLSDVASQLATGTNPLTILIQQGPQVATSISMAGFSLAGLLPILAPVAVAVGVLGAAWYSLSQDLKEAEEAQNRAAAAAEKASQASIRLNSLQAKAQDAELIATGKATEKDLELRDALAAVTAEYGPRIEASKAAIAAAEAERDAATRALQTSSNTNQQLQEAYNTQQDAARAADFHRRELAGLEQQQGALLQTTVRGVVVTNEKGKADDGAGRAARAHSDAIRAQEEALRSLSAAMQAENDAAEATQRTYQGALDGLARIEESNRAATRSEYERIEAQHAATMEQIRAGEQAALAVTSTEAGRETAYQQAEAARLSAREAYNQALADLDARRTAEMERTAAEQVRIEAEAMDSRIQLASTLAGALVGITQAVGQNMTEEQKQGAQALFAVQKAATLAQIALNTILAVSQASASAPPPYNAIPMAIAAATGAAQFVAAAASPPPKFHQGTLSAAAPGAARGREFMSVLEEGEAVIPRATMQQPGAREQAAALVSGRSPVAADEVARGMDRSIVPAYLAEIAKLLRAKSTTRERQARPGHRVAYGAT